MSYCRWSSNSHQCDVYVYDATDGVTVHVASSRIVLPEDMPAEPSFLELPAGEWVTRHNEWTARLNQCQVAPIGLPHDGESHYGLSLVQAADLLERFAAVGYLVPPDVITTLREEQEELATETL